MANILTNEDGSQQLVDESGIFLTDEEPADAGTVFDDPMGHMVPRVVTVADWPLPILGTLKLIQPGVADAFPSQPGFGGTAPKRLPRGQVFYPQGWHFVR